MNPVFGSIGIEPEIDVVLATGCENRHLMAEPISAYLVTSDCGMAPVPSGATFRMRLLARPTEVK